nr:TraU family protein [Aeromonas sp. FDAARGOS 1405]
MFYDIPCLSDEGYDVAMMTEILPTWNNEILSMIVNPESILFANPVAALTCSADAAISHQCLVTPYFGVWAPGALHTLWQVLLLRPTTLRLRQEWQHGRFF